MNKAALTLHIINIIPFVIAATSDIKQRSISFGKIILVNFIPFIVFLLCFDWKLNSSLVYIGFLFLAIGMISYYRAIGNGDILISISLFSLVLACNKDFRIGVMITGLTGIILSCIIWYLFRITKSLKASGYPKSFFDIVALFYGRIELEPHLSGYFCNQKNKYEYMLSYIESFRTPDKYRLFIDPCPFIVCMLFGYILMLIYIL